MEVPHNLTSLHYLHAYTGDLGTGMGLQRKCFLYSTRRETWGNSSLYFHVLIKYIILPAFAVFQRSKAGG